MPDDPSAPPLKSLLKKAREATHQLRDYAREHGMDFRRRDPLVMAIHDALDAAEAAGSVARRAEVSPPAGSAPREPLTPLRTFKYNRDWAMLQEQGHENENEARYAELDTEVYLASDVDATLAVARRAEVSPPALTEDPRRGASRERN